MRQTRSDCRVGNLEKKLGIPEGTFRHTGGRKMRKDKTLKALRRELEIFR